MTGPWRAWEIALTRPERFVVGLMSGTSVDGIDAALVRFDRETHFPELVTFRETPWRPEEREMLLAAAAGRGNAERVAHLHFLVGARFAEAVEELLRCSGIRADAVGNHGQTIAHRPPTPGGSGATLQIGCAASIARSSGCVVVHDFRSADVVAGGHGAPLVPCVDALLHRSASEDRILLNVGGVANVTWLPAGLGTVGVRGFDTGPGNCLMDAWAARLTEGRLAMDPDGAMAARGNCDRPLLERLRSMPGLELGPPRSFDRGAIEAWADPIVSQAAQTMDPETILATLAEFTATTISDAIDRTIVDGRRASVWISGGGARNPTLVSRLRSLLAPRTIATNELQGVPPDAKESFAFAVLADAALRGQRLGLPSVTGAASPSLLGSFAFP